MWIRHYTHWSEESVTERGVVVPSLSSVRGRGRRVVDTWTTHMSIQDVEVEVTFHDDLKLDTEKPPLFII